MIQKVNPVQKDGSTVASRFHRELSLPPVTYSILYPGDDRPYHTDSHGIAQAAVPLGIRQARPCGPAIGEALQPFPLQRRQAAYRK